MPEISNELKKLLEKQQYSFIGNHSAIKICEWTKKSLTDKGVCYKEQFYSIKSHRCCQLSTTVNHCQNRCVFCWRPVEYTKGIKLDVPADKPKEIIEQAILAQRKMLNGFPGNEKVNMKKFEEAQEPNQFAISLSGEPTLYPKLGELIKEIHSRKATSFVVSNGLCPEALEKLNSSDSLPTQLYISLDAPNEELFRKIDRPVIKNAWKKLNKTFNILKKLKGKTRTAVRITLIKGMNMLEPENYAELIEKAEPDFVEVKAYMFVGFSRQRLEIKNMPRHEEVKEFAEEIAKHLKNYRIKDEKKESRVVLLAFNHL